VKIVYFTTVNTPEGLKLSREIRARKLGDIAPSSAIAPSSFTPTWPASTTRFSPLPSGCTVTWL
jgi:hypothetical protein